MENSLQNPTPPIQEPYMPPPPAPEPIVPEPSVATTPENPASKREITMMVVLGVVTFVLIYSTYWQRQQLKNPALKHLQQRADETDRKLRKMFPTQYAAA